MVAIVTLLLYSLSLIVVAILAIITKDIEILETSLLTLLKFLAVYYLSLSLYTVLQFIAERDRIFVSKKLMLITVALNPFFINLFIYQAVVALFSKNIGWKKIERADEILSIDELVNDEENVTIGVNNG